MKKKFLSILTLCIMVLICAIGLVACNGDDTGNVDNRDKQIVSIYNTYVAYAKENGQTPLSYEEWLNSIKGKDGINGKDGLGVKSVVVNNDGHLIITYTDNNSVDAGLVKGKDGLDGNTFTIEISNDGYWVIGGKKTNVKAQATDGKDGKNGQDGVTPTISISQDGYWVINNEKTSVKAVGVDGKNGTNGTNGQDGSDGVGIADMRIENGKLFVKYTNSQDFVELGQVLGKDGKDGVDGQDGVDGNDGKDGVGIADIKIEDGKLYVKYTNSENYIELGQVLGADGNDGVDGKDGKDGKDGREIKSAEIDKDGNLIITYKDDTTENLGKIKDNSKCEHEYSDYIITEIGDIGYRKEYYCKKCHEEKSELYIYTLGIEYALSEDGESAYVKSIGTATDKEIVLRNTYHGKPVTCIREHAFDRCDSFSSIVIPNSVTSIGSWAFQGCGLLANITIPKSVISIGYLPFAGCDSLTNIYYNGEIDSWVEIEGVCHLTECNGFSKQIYINNELITEAVITTATKINMYAFYNCSSLTSVTIGDGVTSIGYKAFDKCSNLTKVNYTGTIDGWVQIEGLDNLMSMSRELYINNELITEAVITTATKINMYAFSYCSSLESITIGSSVTSIGWCAFGWCSSLKSLNISNGVVQIGGRAFYNCEKLKNVSFGSSVKIIDEFAFCNIEGIKVDYLGSIDDWCEIEFGKSANPSSNNGELYINGKLLKEANLMNEQKINDYTFSGCVSLESVIIGENVKSIGALAFWYCRSAIINMENGIEYIGERAFSSNEINYNGTILEWGLIEKDQNWFDPASPVEETITIHCIDGDITLKK